MEVDHAPTVVLQGRYARRIYHDATYRVCCSVCINIQYEVMLLRGVFFLRRCGAVRFGAVEPTRIARYDFGYNKTEPISSLRF